MRWRTCKAASGEGCPSALYQPYNGEGWFLLLCLLHPLRRGHSLTSSVGLSGPNGLLNDPSAPSVRLEAVTKRFGDFVAVRELSLDIERGEFFTLLGPSGCGKTTTLRMVAGFEEPSEGRIVLAGEDVSGV